MSRMQGGENASGPPPSTYNHIIPGEPRGVAPHRAPEQATAPRGTPPTNGVFSEPKPLQRQESGSRLVPASTREFAAPRHYSDSPPRENPSRQYPPPPQSRGDPTLRSTDNPKLPPEYQQLNINNARNAHENRTYAEVSSRPPPSERNFSRPPDHPPEGQFNETQRFQPRAPPQFNIRPNYPQGEYRPFRPPEEGASSGVPLQRFPPPDPSVRPLGRQVSSTDIAPPRFLDNHPGDGTPGPRPEGPPLLRQGPPPQFRPPGIRSFRQFVSQQLIPQAPRREDNGPRPSYDGMGVSQSRSLADDPSRLIQLARSQAMENSTRPPSESHDGRPMPPKTNPELINKEMPPRIMDHGNNMARKYGEPQHISEQGRSDSFSSSQQPDSIKSNILPSGKPAVKEMTITVSGKLPPQPQPPRARPEDVKIRTDNRPLPGRKPEETAKHGDYLSDTQRRSGDPDRPFSEPDRFNTQLQRGDSSGTLKQGIEGTGTFRTDEGGRPLGARQYPGTDRFGENRKPPEIKRPESTMSQSPPESEKLLMGIPYVDSETTLATDSDPKQRPSELNLSGNISDKKGRVGWKGGELERKISDRSTPSDKGVSFVETPRQKTSDTKVPGTWCAKTGRFIPSLFDRPKSPDPRPKTPTTPKIKRSIGSYCPKTGRYIPPSEEGGTPDGSRTPDWRPSSRAMTPREDYRSNFPDSGSPFSRTMSVRQPRKPLLAFGSVVPPPPPKHYVKRSKSDVGVSPRNTWRSGTWRSGSATPRTPRGLDGDHDSGVDEATQGRATTNGEVKGGSAAGRTSRAPAASKLPTHHKRASTPGTPGSPVCSPLKSPNKPHPLRSASLTPEPTAERKKLPMNKIQVGNAPSPNLKVVRSKIGSLENTTHKPGGGQVRIENRKIDFSSTSSRIAAKNDTYQPGGGEKKIESKKLQWNAKSKIGSLENATHKAGGGEKKIETVKLDFKDKAKSKVGSKDNIKHQPGGGAIKIEDRKLDFNVTSKVGSMANVKHKPGGGDVKIFDDKEYMRQMSGTQSVGSSEGQASGTQSPSNKPTSPQPGAQPLSPAHDRS